jgi:hypothetical protein
MEREADIGRLVCISDVRPGQVLRPTREAGFCHLRLEVFNQETGRLQWTSPDTSIRPDFFRVLRIEDPKGNIGMYLSYGRLFAERCRRLEGSFIPTGTYYMLYNLSGIEAEVIGHVQEERVAVEP